MPTYQAITTKYLGPTQNRGARVKARSQVGSLTLPYDYGLDPVENHRLAAMALADRWGWKATWIGGALPSRNGYAFVRVP